MNLDLDDLEILIVCYMNRAKESKDYEEFSRLFIKLFELMNEHIKTATEKYAEAKKNDDKITALQIVSRMEQMPVFSEELVKYSTR